MLQRIKAKLTEQKGFTLVEMLVVLVILAILAALMLPSLTGYIDKAKEKRVMTEVHQVVTAAQTLADEVYAMTLDHLGATDYTKAIKINNIQELSEVSATIESVVIEIDSGKVVYVKIESGNIIGVYGDTAPSSDVDTTSPAKYEIQTNVSSESLPLDPSSKEVGNYAVIE